MANKTCVVTGANSGIGLVTARVLVAQGARVLMVCRNESRGTQAAQHIEEATGSRPELVLCDLSDPQQIEQAAAQITQTCARLDVLINNAGAYFPTRKEDSRGLELTFAVNHLGPFHLTMLLIDSLKASSSARIVNVASRAHTRAKIDFKDLQRQARAYTGMSAYCDSKLMNIWFTRELARRLATDGVTANALHPGVIASEFGQDEPGWLNLGMRLVKPLLTTPEKGAQTTLYLATSSEVSAISGQYFAACRPKRPSAAAQNDENAAALWELSCSLCGLTPSGAPSSVAP